MDNHELETRVSKLENSFDAMKRMEEKIDNIAEITTKIASIEERHHYQSTAIERAFKAIEKNAQQMELLREAFIAHDKMSASTVAAIKEETRKTITTYSEESDKKYSDMKSNIQTIEKNITEKVSWVKGAWFAASILIVIIQFGVVFALRETIEAISETKNAVVELRIEETKILQDQKNIKEQINALTIDKSLIKK